MRTNRFKLLWLWILAVLLVGTFQIWAQVTNAPAGGNGSVIPTDPTSLWDVGIAVVIPMIVQGIKWLAPKIPSAILPFTTPVLGLIIGLALNYFNIHHFSWWDAAKAGALAVSIREMWNQAVTKNFSGSTTGGGSSGPPSS